MIRLNDVPSYLMLKKNDKQQRVVFNSVVVGDDCLFSEEVFYVVSLRSIAVSQM